MTKRYPDGGEVSPSPRAEFERMLVRYLSGLGKAIQGDVIKGGDIRSISISFKGPNDVLVVVRRLTADSGTPEVHFESAYDLGSLIQALEKCIQAERWKPDMYPRK